MASRSSQLVEATNSSRRDLQCSLSENTARCYRGRRRIRTLPWPGSRYHAEVCSNNVSRVLTTVRGGTLAAPRTWTLFPALSKQD